MTPISALLAGLIVVLFTPTSLVDARRHHRTELIKQTNSADSDVMRTFGTGLSANELGHDEQEVFNYTLSDTGRFAVMTHFWCTSYPSGPIDQSIWSYYIDGETTPSIVFTPSMAAGVGFNDPVGPWGNKWVAKNAKSGGWVNNFRIPFFSSIKVTGRLSPATNQTSVMLWTMVRGAENLRTWIGDVQLPEMARLVQSRVDAQTLMPLEWLPLIDIKSGSNGLLFFHTISVESTTINFIEGCYHAYTPHDQAFPGLILGTGTEDYFSSAFAFDGGVFHSEASGCTHLVQEKNNYQLSAYRIHEQDPVLFNDGFQLVWRNGDVTDSRGFKCVSQNGSTVGSPAKSRVSAYTWAYVW